MTHEEILEILTNCMKLLVIIDLEERCKKCKEIKLASFPILVLSVFHPC